MKRFGAVIVFKDKVTKEAAEKFLRSISDRDTGIIEDPRQPDFKCPSGAIIRGHNGVHEYDDAIGGPTWYIP